LNKLLPEIHREFQFNFTLLPQHATHAMMRLHLLAMQPPPLPFDSGVPPSAIQNVWHVVCCSSKFPTALTFTLTLITIFH
jgi:hypothetical protein